MSDPESREMPQPTLPEKELEEEVGKKEARKLKARRKKSSIWFGLGMMGMIGWSVALPMALGALLGHELDCQCPHGQISWTLTGLFLGALLGCLHAWYWIERNRHVEETPNDKGGRDGDA